MELIHPPPNIISDPCVLLNKCSDEILRLFAPPDLFLPQPACALALTCKQLHRVFRDELNELRDLRADARRLATDAGGLVKVLTIGIFALKNNVEEIKRSAGFGGYCFKASDAVLVAKLCQRGAFAHVRLVNMSMGHLGLVGSTALADAIASGGLRLRELCLDDAHVTDDGCIAIAEALRSKQRDGEGTSSSLLESLSLRRNGIGDKGAVALARMLSDGSSSRNRGAHGNRSSGSSSSDNNAPWCELQSLRLGKNPIGFEGIEAVTAAVEALSRARTQQQQSPSQPQPQSQSPLPPPPPPQQQPRLVELELDPPSVKVGRPERPTRPKRPAEPRPAAAPPSEGSGRRRAERGGPPPSPPPQSSSSAPGPPPPLPPSRPVSRETKSTEKSGGSSSTTAALIARVLEIRIRHDGAMTTAEASRLLQICGEKKPKWLLAQVHPDKQPQHKRLEAAAAAARVNQAMDVLKSRRVVVE